MSSTIRSSVRVKPVGLTDSFISLTSLIKNMKVGMPFSGAPAPSSSEKKKDLTRTPF